MESAYGILRELTDLLYITLTVFSVRLAEYIELQWGPLQLHQILLSHSKEGAHWFTNNQMQ